MISAETSVSCCVTYFGKLTIHNYDRGPRPVEPPGKGDPSRPLDVFHEHRKLAALVQGTAEHGPLEQGCGLPLDVIHGDSQLELEGAHKREEQRLDPA